MQLDIAEKAHAQTASSSLKGRVVLLSVNEQVREFLRQTCDSSLHFVSINKTNALFTELTRSKSSVDAVVLGVDIKEPVRVAQRVHAGGRDIPMVILTEPDRHERLNQALKFAPFVGNNITPLSVAALRELPDALLEAVQRARKRQNYQGSILASQKRMSDFGLERPKVTHFLDRLLDHAPIGVLNVDINGLVLGLNRRACHILKCTEREVLGTPLVDIFPESEQEALRSMIALCVAPARRRAQEVFRVCDPPGAERYVEVITSALVDRSGQLGATLILEDVSDRVRAEQERQKAEESLRISERRYRELVQTMSEALALTDEHHRITLINDSFCRMFGYVSEEVVGKNLLEFVHDDHRAMLEKCMSKKTPSEGVQRYETAWVSKDGDKFYTLTCPKKIFGPDGEYLGCLGVFTDITERKQAEELQKMHMMELAHVTRLTTMGEMSSQIAHELAQPLTAIAGLSAGCLKLLQTDESDKALISESLSDISQQANRAREIVVRLRNFVRDEELQYTDLDMNELVRSAVHLLELEARWHGFPLELDLGKQLPRARGDRILIEQVVLNLVHNATEAMQQIEQERRKLSVRTRKSAEDTVMVEVIDTGPGIDQSTMRKIFDPFFSTKPEGMGMGLAITRSIIKAHEGTLTAIGNEAGGTTFRCTLPIAEAG